MYPVWRLADPTWKPAYLFNYPESESGVVARSHSPEGHENSTGHLISLSEGKAHVIGTAPVTIGRGPSSDISVHREDVSRSHAYLMRTPEGFLLVDSSLHGTYVNGERVQAQRLLTHGDVLQIGDCSFRFDLLAMEPAAPLYSPTEPPQTG
jgi:pSer/pThr/pTyr-binding forkhead associated (FHA) protein